MRVPESDNLESRLKIGSRAGACSDDRFGNVVFERRSNEIFGIQLSDSYVMTCSVGGESSRAFAGTTLKME